MIAKNQLIDNSDIWFEIRAPQWLSDALVKAMDGLFRDRKYHRRGEDQDVELGMSRMTQFFDEVACVERTIRTAAEAVGVKLTDVQLTKLYESTSSFSHLAILNLCAEFKLLYEPWPRFDSEGLYFVVELEGTKFSKAEIVAELEDISGKDASLNMRLSPDP